MPSRRRQVKAERRQTVRETTRRYNGADVIRDGRCDRCVSCKRAFPEGTEGVLCRDCWAHSPYSVDRELSACCPVIVGQS